jgi:hypothetical protein
LEPGAMLVDHDIRDDSRRQDCGDGRELPLMSSL